MRRGGGGRGEVHGVEQLQRLGARGAARARGGRARLGPRRGARGCDQTTAARSVRRERTKKARRWIENRKQGRLSRARARERERERERASGSDKESSERWEARRGLGPHAGEGRGDERDERECGAKQEAGARRGRAARQRRSPGRRRRAARVPAHVQHGVARQHRLQREGRQEGRELLHPPLPRRLPPSQHLVYLPLHAPRPVHPAGAREPAAGAIPIGHPAAGAGAALAAGRREVRKVPGAWPVPRRGPARVRICRGQTKTEPLWTRRSSSWRAAIGWQTRQPLPHAPCWQAERRAGILSLSRRRGPHPASRERAQGPRPCGPAGRAGSSRRRRAGCCGSVARRAGAAAAAAPAASCASVRPGVTFGAPVASNRGNVQSGLVARPQTAPMPRGSRTAVAGGSSSGRRPLVPPRPRRLGRTTNPFRSRIAHLHSAPRLLIGGPAPDLP